MKKILATLAIAALSVAAFAQTEKSRTVEDGGTGPYKALMVGDASAPAFTLYRPANLAAAVEKEGKLPVILYGNGGCANSTVEIRFFLNELASYGYVAIGIGPYDDEDTNEHWKQSLINMYPDGKKVILSNGEEVKPLPQEERQKIMEELQKEIEKQMKERSENPQSANVPVMRMPTYAGQLLEAMDWLTAENADPKSEYYHMLDLDKVAAMGQSCGGAQALAVAHDPRIKTCVILNSGIGDMEMQGATKANLENLHTPMFYLIGGPSDIAFPNAAKDFERIGSDIPVVMMNTVDGHLGTYYERSGGPYAVAVLGWLDWQLKGDQTQARFFLDDQALKQSHPDWTVERKNWPRTQNAGGRPGAQGGPGQMMPGPGGAPGPQAGQGGGNPFGNMSREEMEAMFRRMNTPPSDPAYRVEEIGCTSAGNKIFGEAFIPVSGGKHPTIIMSHGYGSTNTGFYNLASSLAKEGYVCYCYDFAGGSSRSRSEGRTQDMSIFTEKQNLIDVLDMVRGWDFVDKKNIFLLGESQGGCVSAITAPDVKKKINSILLTYPALCIPDDGYALYPTVADIPETVNFMGMEIGKAYYEPLFGYDIYKDIARYQGDVLIVHGTNDSLVKPDYSAKAMNVYKNAELHLIFGAGHGFRGEDQVSLYHGYVRDFLKRHLK